MATLFTPSTKVHPRLRRTPMILFWGNLKTLSQALAPTSGSSIGGGHDDNDSGGGDESSKATSS